jgi:4-hydroxybenzoate polyprenyltransferase
VGKAKDWALIARPPIILIAVMGASVGFLNVTIGEGQLFPTVGWAVNALAAGLLAAGLMVHNDYFDLSSDKVNRPHKALVQGRIKPRTARDVGFGLMILGVAAAFAGHQGGSLIDSLNLVAGAIAITVLLDGLVYNTVGKKHGIFGHVEVAYGVALIPIFGAAGGGFLLLLWPLGLGLFVMEIGREIMVGAGDIEGDRQAGWVTFAVSGGMRRALIVALVLYMVALPAFLAPWIVPGLAEWRPSLLYLAGSVGFIAGLVALWIPCWRKPDFASFEKYIRTGSRVLVLAFQALLLVEAFV